MLIRLLLTLPALAAAGWFLHGEQQLGRFQWADDAYLDFLVAHSRDQFQHSNPQGDVVLVEIREEDRAEYADWPPPPLDWQTLLRELQAYSPEQLVIASPLRWPTPAPDFAPAVAEALLPFESVVLGVGTGPTSAAGPATAALGDLEAKLPKFHAVAGNAEAAPFLTGPLDPPDSTVAGQTELGLMCLEKEGSSWSLPYAVAAGDRLLPTLLAQSISRQSRSPYSKGQRLRLGTGAGAFLQNGFYVPLADNGSLPVQNLPEVPSINALNLMAGSLADATPEKDKELLQKARLLVIGITSAATDAQPSLPRLYARALNHLLSLPKFRAMPEMGQWAISGAAALLALWLAVRVSRERALFAGAVWILVCLTAGFLVFQSSLLWFSPVLPVGLLASGALLARLLGRSRKAVPAPVPPVAEAAGAGSTKTSDGLDDTKAAAESSSPKTADSAPADSAPVPATKTETAPGKEVPTDPKSAV